MHRLALAALAALVALATATYACKPASNDQACADAQAVDTDLMAYLSAARALHHEANVKEDASDVPGAIAAMQRLVDKRPPREAPEIEEVRADAYARMAELKIRTKDLEGALRDIDAGLAHATAPTYFRGHLLEVEGIAFEEQAKSLDAQGNKDGAAAARAKALKVSDEAVKIQFEVIDRALGDGGKR